MRTVISFLLLVSGITAVIALIVLGQAWLLQKIFGSELWQIALIVLGAMALVIYVIAQVLASERTSFPFFMPPDLEFADDEEEDDVLPVTPDRPNTRRKKPRRRK